MAYVLLPNVGNTLGGTRDQIRTNFTELQTTIDQNHIDMDGSFPGKHKMSQYNIASFPGTGSFQAGDANLYGKVGSSGNSEIFFSPDATTNEYQLTYSNSAAFATWFGKNAIVGNVLDPNQVGGWTFLPGGLILNYGSSTYISASSQTMQFALKFPTNIFSIVLQGQFSTSSNINVTQGVSFTTTSFRWNTSANISGTVYFWAIGN